MTAAVGYMRLLLSLLQSVLASCKLAFTSSWAEGASSPRFTVAYQPDAAFAQSPPPLSTRFLPSASPLHLPPYVEEQINNPLKSLSATFCLSVHLLLCLQWFEQVKSPYSVTVKGPGDEVLMDRGDRSFVGVNTRDPWVAGKSDVRESVPSISDLSYPARSCAFWRSFVLVII